MAALRKGEAACRATCRRPHQLAMEADGHRREVDARVARSGGHARETHGGTAGTSRLTDAGATAICCGEHARRSDDAQQHQSRRAVGQAGVGAVRNVRSPRL